MSTDIGPYRTATEMLVALDNKTISSTELVEMHVQRIEERDGTLNAIPVRTFDRAREAAERADRARASNEPAPLLGLPLTLKESTQTAGLPQSAGIEPLKDYRPASDGPIAQRVFAAGACLLGKTNIPVALSDWQADSPVYGRTSNPWNLECTPGGSTGGGAAALAAGMTPLEIGSDIGGSIRVPAAYCGLYGHRPSETAVPRSGAFPFGDLENLAIVMGVQGPLARSAIDLELLFDVVAGPSLDEKVGWHLGLPEARGEQLSEFRVAIMPSLDMVQPSAEMRAKVDEHAVFLEKAGAKVGEAMPDVDRRAYFNDYMTLLAVSTSIGESRSARERTALETAGRNQEFMDAMGKGFTLDAVDYIMLLNRREVARQAWRAFFNEWDVLVCPAALDAAFQHHIGPQLDRALNLDGTEVPYMLNFVYPMWAIFTGQPATAFPAGLNSTGLPLGLQAIGPYLEDRTTMRFAQLLERQWYSFTPPPSYTVRGA